jgi:hypothetical protein
MSHPTQTTAPNETHPRSRRRALLLLLSLSCLLPACSERRETSSQDPGAQEPGGQ